MNEQNTPRTSRRLLVIDDSPDIHRDFDKILLDPKPAGDLDALEQSLFGGSLPQACGGGDGFEIDHAHQGQEGFEYVRRSHEEGKPYVAAFIDMRMPPGWDGLQTIREIRRIDQDLPIVVCTAYSDQSWNDIAQQAGALDKLLILKKPFDPIELMQLAWSLKERFALSARARVRTDQLESLVELRTAELEAARRRDHVRMEELETIVEQRTGELRRQAMHDKLTGLPNRAMLYDRLAQAIGRLERSTFAVLFIDFDRFKRINDSLGHEYGDKLLVSIAGRLTRTLVDVGQQSSVVSTAARLGGDEFCVLLEGLTGPDDAESIARRLLASLAAPHNLAGHEVSSTASIGITLGTIGYAIAEDMLRDADIAMYRAKQMGRARCVVFDQVMREQAMKRLQLENALRHVIERDELALLYQPVISLETAEITGFEAVLSWQPSEFEVVSREEFDAVVEESAQAVQIGQWAVREACRQLLQWQQADNFGRKPYVSLNVSRRQFTHDSFLPNLRRAMTEFPVDPSGMVIEVVESAVIGVPGLTADVGIAAVHGVRELGAKVYIDDFGAGFASLGNLQRIEFDGIKLDRSFLHIAQSPRRAAALIHSVATLSRDMGVELVVQGIESLEQLALLQAIGCERGQGLLFAKPSPAHEIDELITSRRRLIAA